MEGDKKKPTPIIIFATFEIEKISKPSAEPFKELDKDVGMIERAQILNARIDSSSNSGST